MTPRSPASVPEAAAARGIRRLIGPVRAHVLEDPSAYAKLTDLRCGDSRSEPAVQEVEQTAARLVRGATTMAQTPVVLEDESGHLLGYASVHRRPALGYEDGRPRPWIADRYIVAFGRDRSYRDHRLRDNHTRIGELLLRAALDMIALEARGGPMPSVSALVRPENEASHRVLERLDFDHLPMDATGYAQDLRWRDRGLALPPPLPREVYIPPSPDAWPPASPQPHLRHASQPRLRSPGRNDPCPCGSRRKWKRCCAAHGGVR
jgi:hypothetical protein